MTPSPEMQQYLDSVAAGERAAYEEEQADREADERARQIRQTFFLIRGGRYGKA